MKQIFTEQSPVPGTLLTLDEKTAHHIFDVLRTSPKETIRVVDGSRSVFIGHACQKPQIRIDEKLETAEGGQPQLTLCAALIKADRFEWMLQKAAELGVSRIVPFTCRNTVVTIDDRKLARKMERWNSILEGACRQSNRTSQVRLETPCTIGELPAFQSALNLLAWEKEDGSHHLCCELADLEDSATFVIGPEGGLTPEEAARLEAQGFVPVSLGARILRAETAACYLLSAADYAWQAKTAACCRETVSDLPIQAAESEGGE